MGSIKLRGTRGGIPEDGHARQCRYRRLQDLEPFPGELGEVHEYPGEVAAGPRNRLHETRRDGITLEVEGHNWDCRRRGVHRHHARPSYGEDQIRTESCQLCRERRQGAAVAEPQVKRQIASFDVPGSAERLAKPAEVGPKEAVVRAWIEHADPPDLPCLLCLARERHKRETQRENEPDQPHAHLTWDGWREV